MKSLLALLAVPVLVAPAAHAQQTVKIEVRVTASTGGSYYLDKGRGAALELGDRVRFFPDGLPSCEGTIRAVSKNSARADLDPGSAAISVGVRGEVLVPRERLDRPVVTPAPVADDTPPAASPLPPRVREPVSSGVDAPVPPEVPSHPAWTHPPEEWTKDSPLLAPAFGLAPAERERMIHGRAYVQAQGTWDNEGGTRKYYTNNLGVDASMDNPFGQGGSLRIDATLWRRSADSDAEDFHSSDSSLRLNRLTYQFGGTDDQPTRWQFGRFLQYGMPEFGVLDGAEWNRRLGGGSVVGASVGAMPEPYPNMKSFEDTQAAVFCRHAFDATRKNTAAIGYQNTWHKGEQDRNLFLFDTSLQPSESVSVRSSAWLDWYGSEDVIKDHGPELTEFLVSTSWRATVASGLALTLSHRKIPELLRSEFQEFQAQSIKDSTLDRVALNGWLNVTPKIRVDARGDHWSDQDDSGSTADVGVSLRDIAWDEGEVRASAFYADGSFSSGPGFRAQASKSFGRVYASLAYEFVDYEQKDFTGQQRQLGQHALFGSLDLPLFESWDLSLLGERRFGDEQDSYSLGFLLQTRF